MPDTVIKRSANQTIEAPDMSSGEAAINKVLTADGIGGATWETDSSSKGEFHLIFFSLANPIAIP